MNGRKVRSGSGSANSRILATIAAALLLCASGAWGDVFNMPPGLTSLEFVTVGNPGNGSDPLVASDGTSGYGSVGYVYRMGKFEVTAGQYAEFLNAVGAADAYGLYNTEMANENVLGFIDGCNIIRSGSPGGYTYSVAPDWANRPVNFVSWGDAARFANWLTNGQPTGAQDLTTTEDGSYLLNGATTDAELMAVTRKADALYAIPSEDEWYKAAYHKNDGLTANYFRYPTASDAMPSNDLLDPDPGNNATFYIPGDTGDDTIGSPYWRTEAGAHENSDSPYGTFDQGGNIAEWDEAVVHPLRGPSRGMRGGACLGLGGDMSAGNRLIYDHPTAEFTYAGLRVAMVPEPACGVLLLLGMVLVPARNGGRRRECSSGLGEKLAGLAGTTCGTRSHPAPRA